MKIIGKSRVDETALIAKKSKTKYIEIQLFDDFDTGATPESLFEIIKKVKDVEIGCVHAPLYKDDRADLENIYRNKVKNLLCNTIKLAGLCSEYYNHTIKVVLHNTEDINYWDNDSNFKLIVDLFDKYFDRYPLLDFCIENVTPAVTRIDNSILFKNGCFFESVYLAEKLNMYFSTNRFGTVLDTCHLITTLRIIDLLGINQSGYTIDTFFQKNKDVVKLIHLANVINLGFNAKVEHGVVFSDEHLILMKELIECYKKYEYNCDITIEIKEDDYYESNNFKKNYDDLVKILNELEISY